MRSDQGPRATKAPPRPTHPRDDAEPDASHRLPGSAQPPPSPRRFPGRTAVCSDAAAVRSGAMIGKPARRPTSPRSRCGPAPRSGDAQLLPSPRTFHGRTTACSHASDGRTRAATGSLRGDRGTCAATEVATPPMPNGVLTTAGQAARSLCHRRADFAVTAPAAAMPLTPEPTRRARNLRGDRGAAGADRRLVNGRPGGARLLPSPRAFPDQTATCSRAAVLTTCATTGKPTRSATNQRTDRAARPTDDRSGPPRLPTAARWAAVGSARSFVGRGGACSHAIGLRSCAPIREHER